MSIDLQEYKKLYLQTSQDLLHDIASCVQSLEEDFSNMIMIDTAHRSAHSFKSQSLVMGYTQTGLAGKILEKLFKNAKEKTIELNDEILTSIRELLNSMQQSLDSIQDNHGEGNLSQAIQKLEANTTIKLLD